MTIIIYESPSKQCSTCSNTIGTYTCDCPDGWKHETGNQAQEGCIHDVDECANDVTICENAGDGLGGPAAGREFAICTNTVGSYECGCNVGYWFTLDWGSHRVLHCHLSSSYVLIIVDNPASDEDCDDVDECTETDPALMQQCSEHATCTNTFGSYTCTCDAGYTDDKDGDGVGDTDGRVCWTEIVSVG